MDKYDFIIIGAGIVGLATSLNLLKLNPQLNILILEKENKLGQHQTGNNSGVIHSGIYYKPGSIKAINCKRGYKLLLDYCKSRKINFKICGKLILATNNEEEERLNSIFRRGLDNGLDGLRLLNSAEIREYEPNVTSKKAIMVPQTGIIDFKKVLKKFAEELGAKGCTIKYNKKVTSHKEFTEYVKVESEDENFESKFVITCAGLQSDRLAKLSNRNLDIRIIPFRGEYFKLADEKKNIINNLIYPVPNPNFPFLGVHFTKKMDDSIEVGPNAVLAFKREGYTKFGFNLKDTIETVSWPGMLKLTKKYWQVGLEEFYRSFMRREFIKSLNKFGLELGVNDLKTSGAGVRAQACDINGNLLDDFYFSQTKRILHVCNAPSPAATASLAIGEKISKQFLN